MLYPKGKQGADGTGYTQAAIAICQQVRFCVFVLSTLLFYSYHSSSFPIISFSMKYNNRRAGRGRPTRAAMATPGRTGRDRARQVRLLSSVTVFLPTLLFSSSHFYYLFCRELQQQTGRGQVGQDRTGQDGTTLGQQCGTGRGPGGQEEEVGDGRNAGCIIHGHILEARG